MVCVGGGSMKRFGFLDQCSGLPERGWHGSYSFSKELSLTRL